MIVRVQEIYSGYQLIMMWWCTCQPPPTVDLTDALNNKNKSEDESLLRCAMSRWGWCHISVDLTRLTSESPLKSLQPLAMKNMVRDMFDPSFVARNDIDAIYRGRTAESGAATSAQAEPKESWEVRRCCCQPTSPIHEWTEALHSIATAVTCTLKLPSNLLLRQDACHCKKGEQCSVDLLRVFFYDAVGGEAMGSSPHTDWGSWTVVWQDDVGGLQTYCHAHERWVDVAASPLQASRATFVVHVGDVTSLAMGHASRSTQDHDPIIIWPSPKHRVISPTNSIPRASLVYFAYPPPGISLQDMEEALVPHIQAECPAVIPYNEYFVLRNQSSRDAQVRLPEEMYRAIRSRPLDSVFAEKWQQVQRPS